MLLSLATFLLTQLVVVERAPHAPDAPMTAEIIQRPAGLSTSAFLDQVIDEADAGEWERSEHVGPVRGVEMRIVGLRRTSGDGLMLFMPAAEDSRGNICRIRRVREGSPVPQREELLRYCTEAIAAGR